MLGTNLSREKITEKIIAQTSQTKEAIDSMIEEKKKKFEGLLNDSGASIMVAKEFGVDIEQQADSKIPELEEGAKDIRLKAVVAHVFPPKNFEKNGKKGTLLNTLITDGKNEIRLTLWNDQAQKFEEEKIERGDEIELANCVVSSFNGKKQLSLGYAGTIKLAKKGKAEKYVSLKDLEKGQNSVDVYCILSRVYDERTFNSNNREGRLIAFQVNDDTATLRGVAWNDAVQEILKVKEGSKIKIEGAYTKEGMNGIEINLGYTSRVIVDP